MMSVTRFEVRAEEVSAKAFDGEVVILHLGTCSYYSADGTGAAVWSAIEAGWTVDEITGALADRYSVDRARARADVDAFLAFAIEEGLIRERADGNGRAARMESPDGEGVYQPPVLQAYRDMIDLLALDPPLPELDDPHWRRADDARG